MGLASSVGSGVSAGVASKLTGIVGSAAAATDPHPLYPAFDRIAVKAHLDSVYAAGVAAGKLPSATNDWDTKLLATPPTQPTITSTTTASTAAAVRTAALTGSEGAGIRIEVTADIAGTVELQGCTDFEIVASAPGRRVGAFVFDKFNSSGQLTRRGRIIGFEVGLVQNIFGFGAESDPDVQDITVIGCVFNGQVLNSGVVAFNPKNMHRVALINCVLRGGPPTAVEGACMLISTCRDVFVAGCNGRGAPDAVDPGADDWFSRNDGTTGYYRYNFVDNWMKSRYRNTCRIGGGGNGSLYYETPTGTLTNINHGTAFGIRTITLEGTDETDTYVVGGTGWFDDTITVGSVFMGPDSTPGAPYSGEWVCDEYTARGPADVVPSALFTNLQSAEEQPNQYVWMGASNSVVQETASEPAPPTISDPTLLAEGWTGGQPNAGNGVGYTSDPDDLASS